MREYRILFASGPDGPGIVHRVSAFLFDRGCNMEDSRMAVLGGQFAMMLLFSGEPADVARFEGDLSGLAAESGLKVELLPAQAPTAVEPEPALPVRVELVAMDAPGIMVRLTDILRRMRVNIDSLESHLAPAPASGTTISSVKLRIAVPRDVSPVAVKEELTRLATDINVDILFQPVQE
jgi:glycine cleavage system transcriptional repressor